MNKNILEELEQVIIPESSEFQNRIVNSSHPVLGSRVGDIRKIAKKYSADLAVLNEISNNSYEEVLLKGFIIAYHKNSILEKIDIIKEYLKLADSWALIDSFCSTFKIKESEKEELFEVLKEFLNTEEEFSQRFAQIMFLSHFIKFNGSKKLRRPRIVELKDLESNQESNWIDKILNEIDRPYSTYYSQMGAAWLIAEAFLFFPKRILEFLNICNLDDVSFNFTIDKIRQSKNPSKKVKEYLKTFKRN